MEEVGALDTEKRNVECNDERIGVNELPQYRFLVCRLRPTLAWRREYRVSQWRSSAQVLAGLEDVQDAEACLLDKVDDELDSVPDEIEGYKFRVNVGRLLSRT